MMEHFGEAGFWHTGCWLEAWLWELWAPAQLSPLDEDVALLVLG